MFSGIRKLIDADMGHMPFIETGGSLWVGTKQMIIRVREVAELVEGLPSTHSFRFDPQSHMN